MLYCPCPKKYLFSISELYIYIKYIYIYNIHIYKYIIFISQTLLRIHYIISLGLLPLDLWNPPKKHGGCSRPFAPPGCFTWVIWMSAGSGAPPEIDKLHQRWFSSEMLLWSYGLGFYLHVWYISCWWLNQPI